MSYPKGKYTDIIVPTVHIATKSPLEVTVHSPKKLRDAVECIAVFFRREFGYDFVQFSARERNQTYVAYLWIDHEPAYIHVDYDIPCIGATCFRWREYIDFPPMYAMQWVWIHPYYRRHGLLREAWPLFKQRFEYFVCEPPYSPAMKGFLTSMGVESDQVEVVA